MTHCHHVGGTGWCKEHLQSIASCATLREQERCLKIAVDVMNTDFNEVPTDQAIGISKGAEMIAKKIKKDAR